MFTSKNIINAVNYCSHAVSNLIFPRLCFGCDQFSVEANEFFCIACITDLPFTEFEKIRDNPVEKLFWGRAKTSFATSTFFYQEETPIQNAIHRLKYDNQPELGLFFGELMGYRLAGLTAFHDIDYLIPMPLHPKKELSRGYNQAVLLCRGMTKSTGIPGNENFLKRSTHTATQTRKSRIERWENVSDVFGINNNSAMLGKNILLIDDVITTGASTEACIQTLLNAGIGNVSVSSLAFTL
jgi:ComF family protein